uniref:Protein FAM217B n=1 Tax=Oncorhynchus mykiss TaxID=8022 RepID=A0A8C7NV92_ONCMY
MGTVVQQSAATGLNKLPSRVEREWAKSSWTDKHVTSTRMTTQKKPLHPQMMIPSVDNTHIPTPSADKKQQRRQKHKPNIPSVKHNTNTSELSTQGQLDPPSLPLLSALDGKERRERSRRREQQERRERREQREKERREDQEREAQSSHHREQKQTVSRRSRQAVSLPHNHSSSHSSQVLPGGVPVGQRTAQVSGGLGCVEGDVGGKEKGEGDIYSDIDTDLSESERLPLPSYPSSPANLDLRPEVIFPHDFQPDLPGPRGHAPGLFSYPDFLPPPFNSWSLRQLAVFLHPEGRHPPRSRPAGMALDRYLEQLLLLEWLRIQTVQEESGSVSSVPTSRYCSHHGAPSLHGRLSSPKCILQCQRAFPVTLLSSLSPSAPLSGCSHYHARYPPCTGTCHSHTSPCLNPFSDHRGRVSLPKRSYSESRVHSAEKASGHQSCGSPAMGIGHLKRMQAFGNIRNPVAVSPTRRQRSSSVVRNPSFGSGSGTGSGTGTPRGCNCVGSGSSGALYEVSSSVRRRRGRSESERRRGTGTGFGSGTGSGSGTGCEAWERAMERAGFGIGFGTGRGLHWTGSGSGTGAWAWSAAGARASKRARERAGEWFGAGERVGERAGAGERVGAGVRVGAGERAGAGER